MMLSKKQWMQRKKTKKNWIVLGGQLVLCHVKDQRQGRGEFLVQGGVAVEEESRVKKDVREKQKEINHEKKEENQDVKEDGKNTEFFSPQLTKI